MRRAPAILAVVALAVSIAGCGGDDEGARFRADANAAPFAGPVPLQVKFTVRVRGTSGDTWYRWRFDDGTVSHEQNPTHTFRRAGFYQVSVDVRDEENYDRRNLLLGAWPPQVWSGAQEGIGRARILRNLREQQRRTSERRRDQRREALDEALDESPPQAPAS
jgi:PKD domain-containing protein